MRTLGILTVLLMVIAGEKSVEFSQALAISVDTRTCDWNPKVATEALQEGLRRVQQVNPQLVQEIVTNRLGAPLTIICDVTEDSQIPYPNLDPSTSTIHLRFPSMDSVKMRSTIFHEFLHFVNLPYDPETHESESAPLELDPVYACHFVGYPEFAETILKSPEKLETAKETCASVKL